MMCVPPTKDASSEARKTATLTISSVRPSNVTCLTERRPSKAMKPSASNTRLPSPRRAMNGRPSAGLKRAAAETLSGRTRCASRYKALGLRRVSD